LFLGWDFLVIFVGFFWVIFRCFLLSSFFRAPPRLCCLSRPVELATDSLSTKHPPSGRPQLRPKALPHPQTLHLTAHPLDYDPGTLICAGSTHARGVAAEPLSRFLGTREQSHFWRDMVVADTDRSGDGLREKLGLLGRGVIAMGVVRRAARAMRGDRSTEGKRAGTWPVSHRAYVLGLGTPPGGGNGSTPQLCIRLSKRDYQTPLSKHQTLSPQPRTLILEPQALNPIPYTLNLKL
jgi:hypothetical protein